jgi:hypothetical protein
MRGQKRDARLRENHPRIHRLLKKLLIDGLPGQARQWQPKTNRTSKIQLETNHG